MSEDVIVLGHTHHFKSCKVLGKLKNMYYINSGTWIDLVDHVSCVFIHVNPCYVNPCCVTFAQTFQNLLPLAPWISLLIQIFKSSFRTLRIVTESFSRSFLPFSLCGRIPFVKVYALVVIDIIFSFVFRVSNRMFDMMFPMKYFPPALGFSM